MDPLAPIVAQESADRRRHAGARKTPGTARQPAPSFLAPRHVRVYFSSGPMDSSAAVPARRLVANVAPDDRSFQAIEAFSRHLEHLARWSRARPAHGATPRSSVPAAEPLLPDRRLAQSQPVATEGNSNASGRSAAATSVSQANAHRLQQQHRRPDQALMQNARSAAIDPSEAIRVPMTPLWIGDDLLLARRVSLGDGPYLQGCLLDWPKIEAWLVSLQPTWCRARRSTPRPCQRGEQSASWPRAGKPDPRRLGADDPV